MKEFRDMEFTIGRARLMNGPTGSPFPSEWKPTDNDTVQLSGVFHPEAVANESVVERHARSLTFIQQWLGLNDEPDVVPVVSERRPELTGMYRVVRAEINWLRTLTVQGGTVSYRATLRKAKPSSTGGVAELQYMIASLPTDEAAVTPDPIVWIPGAARSSSLGPQKLRLGYGTTRCDGYDPGSLPVVDADRFAIATADYYRDGCTIEFRHSPGDPWEIAVGAQLPELDSIGDIRLSNGLVRYTYGPGATSTNPAVLTLERATATGWKTAGQFYFHTYEPVTPTLDGSWFDGGTPSVQQNSTEIVSVKYPMAPEGNGPMVFLTIGLQRGRVSATFTASGINFRLYELAPAGRTAATGGGYLTATNADDLGWVFASDGPHTFATTGDFFATLSPSSVSLKQWMLGVWSDSPTVGYAQTPADLIEEWWAASGVTQRFVAQ